MTDTAKPTWLLRRPNGCIRCIRCRVGHASPDVEMPLTDYIKALRRIVRQHRTCHPRETVAETMRRLRA